VLVRRGPLWQLLHGSSEGPAFWVIGLAPAVQHQVALQAARDSGARHHHLATRPAADHDLGVERQILDVLLQRGGVARAEVACCDDGDLHVGILSAFVVVAHWVAFADISA